MLPTFREHLFCTSSPYCAWKAMKKSCGIRLSVRTLGWTLRASCPMENAKRAFESRGGWQYPLKGIDGQCTIGDDAPPFLHNVTNQSFPSVLLPGDPLRTWTCSPEKSNASVIYI